MNNNQYNNDQFVPRTEKVETDETRHLSDILLSNYDNERNVLPKQCGQDMDEYRMNDHRQMQYTQNAPINNYDSMENAHNANAMQHNQYDNQMKPMEQMQTEHMRSMNQMDDYNQLDQTEQGDQLNQMDQMNQYDRMNQNDRMHHMQQADVISPVHTDAQMAQMAQMKQMEYVEKMNKEVPVKKQVKMDNPRADSTKIKKYIKYMIIILMIALAVYLIFGSHIQKMFSSHKVIDESTLNMTEISPFHSDIDSDDFLIKTRMVLPPFRDV